MFEHLESRRLRAAISLHDRILTINGTDGSDIVTIQNQRDVTTNAQGKVFYNAHILVTLNGTFLGNFDTTAIDKVKANLMAGDDSMIVGRSSPVKYDMDGGDGNDTLSGGLKNDTLRGGAGDNLMVGGKGNDVFIANGDSDTIVGGLGNDTANFSNQVIPLNITLDDVANDGGMLGFGDVASDIETVLGGGGADTISAAGLDHVVSIFGGGGNDKLTGGFKDDTLKGGPGNDILKGDSGDDYLNGNGGQDRLYGEDGNDTLNGGGPDPLHIPISTPKDINASEVDFTNLTTQLPDIDGLGDGATDVLAGGAGKDTLLSDAFDETTMDITKKVSHPEGDLGDTRIYTFRVTLDAPNTAPILVDYATADGTATAGVDYVATSGQLSFAAGVTSQTITVIVNGDADVEPDETFTVTLSNVVGSAALNNAVGTGLIVNDD